MKKQFIIIGIIILLIGFGCYSGSVCGKGENYDPYTNISFAGETFNQKLESGFDITLIPGVTVEGKYYLNAKMIIADGLPGESKNGEITLSSGEIDLSVDVDIFGVDESGSIDYSLPLGENKKITIPGTLGVLKAKVKVTATIINIVGSDNLQINTASISFGSQTTKSFSYTVKSDAELDDTFDISADVRLSFNFEIFATILTIEQSIATGAIPISTMVPSMSATGTVKAQEDTNGGFSFDLSNPIFLLLIIIIIVVIVIVIAAVAYKKKKSKKKPVPVQKKVEKPITKTKPDPKLKEFKAIETEEKTFEEEVEELKKAKKQVKTGEKPKEEKKLVEKTKKKEPAKEEEKPVETKKRRNFCPKCGKKLEGFSTFCGRCGYKF